MNKIQIKKMVAPQIKVIAQASTDMAISRWERARAFAQIHSMVVWDKSPYGSFLTFVRETFIEVNPSSALLWAINYNQMTKWYTWAQIQTIAKQISYSRAVRAQQAWGTKQKTPLQTFIKFAKSLTNYARTNKVTVPNPNRITLSLPVLYINKFESVLVPHGYVIPKDPTATKHGISDALVKYLDTI